MHRLNGQGTRCRLETGSKPKTPHRLAAEHLGQGLVNPFNGDGKTNALGAHLRTQCCHVDADEVPPQIDERAARITRVNGRVGLDPVQGIEFSARTVLIGTAACAGTQDAPTHRTRVSEGIAQGDDRLAQQEVVVLSKFNGRELSTRRFEPQQRHIFGGVERHPFGLDGIRSVVELHEHSFHTIDHVNIGEHVTFLVDDDTGAAADHRLLHLLQPPSEKFSHQAVVDAVGVDIGRTLDVDHARHHPLDGLHDGVAADIQRIGLR